MAQPAVAGVVPSWAARLMPCPVAMSMASMASMAWPLQAAAMRLPCSNFWMQALEISGDIWRYLEMDAAGNMETYWKHSHHYWKYNLPIFANYGNGNEMELPLLSRCFESSFSVILCCHVEMSH